MRRLCLEVAQLQVTRGLGEDRLVLIVNQRHHGTLHSEPQNCQLGKCREGLVARCPRRVAFAVKALLLEAVDIEGDIQRRALGGLPALDKALDLTLPLEPSRARHWNLE